MRAQQSVPLAAVVADTARSKQVANATPSAEASEAPRDEGASITALRNSAWLACELAMACKLARVDLNSAGAPGQVGRAAGRHTKDMLLELMGPSLVVCARLAASPPSSPMKA